MKISTRFRYGARALAGLATAHEKGPVSVREISEMTRTSPKYLEHIISRLKAAGLILAHRGTQGGYSLAKPPSEIDLSEVFEILEGSGAVVDCVDDPGLCPIEGICPTRETWAEMKDAILQVLRKTTLQDLVDRQNRKMRSGKPMYHI